jgi:microcystin-dependent protein
MNGKNTTTTANKLTAPATNAQPGQVQFNGTTPTPASQKAFSSTNTPDAAFSQQAIGLSGSSTAHSNQQPYLPLNFMIAVNGIFPSPA